MELDEETLDGHWSTNSNTGMDFFIINDAIFSKLCILGEDVEPCFEGSSITAQEVSKHFTKIDDNFKKTLFTMMQDLNYALKGGYEMELEDKNVETEVTTAVEEETVSTEEEITEEVVSTDNEVVEEETVSIDNEETEDIASTEEVVSTEDNEDSIAAEEVKDYSLLEEELETLKAKYAEMEEEYQKLVTFKEAVDNEKKDSLINSFYMLSDEDKKDVIENKSKYSLEEIEAKLSVICVRKKVNFDLDNSEKNEDKIEDVVTTYNLDNEHSDMLPAWLQALKNTRDSKE